MKPPSRPPVIPASGLAGHPQDMANRSAWPHFDGPGSKKAPATFTQGTFSKRGIPRLARSSSMRPVCPAVNAADG